MGKLHFRPVTFEELAERASVIVLARLATPLETIGQHLDIGVHEMVASVIGSATRPCSRWWAARSR